jgi:hypothetical protein
LGTRLDSLQSLLSKLPVKWVFCPIIKELCYYSRAMMTWAQCSVVIWRFLIWKMFVESSWSISFLVYLIIVI